VTIASSLKFLGGNFCSRPAMLSLISGKINSAISLYLFIKKPPYNNLPESSSPPSFLPERRTKTKKPIIMAPTIIIEMKLSPNIDFLLSNYLYYYIINIFFLKIKIGLHI
jgi:hypothetical protein